MVLTHLREILAIGSAGRCLALDLLRLHGDHALPVLEAMLRDAESGSHAGKILLKARRIILSMPGAMP